MLSGLQLLLEEKHFVRVHKASQCVCLLGRPDWLRHSFRVIEHRGVLMVMLQRCC